MPNFPDFILELVRASAEYGRSKFTYFKEKIAGKPSGREVFTTEDYPEKVRVNQKKNESEPFFMERVYEKLMDSSSAQQTETEENE